MRNDYGYGSSYDAQPYDPEAAAKAARKQRKKQQEESDLTCAVKILIFMCGLNTCLFVLPCLGHSWQFQHFTGFGVGKLQVGTSLTSMNVVVGCGKNFLENKLCHQLQKFQGEHNLMRAKDMACVISTGHIITLPEACMMMSHIIYSSFGMLVMTLFAGIFNSISGLLLYYYWFVYQSKQTREWALRMCFLGFVTAFFAIVGYSIASPDLGLFPQAFGGVIYTSMQNSVLGMERTHDVPYGWCWYVYNFGILFNVFTLVAWLIWVKRATEEKEVTRSEKWMRDQAKETAAMIDYGTLQMKAGQDQLGQFQAQQQQFLGLQQYQAQQQQQQQPQQYYAEAQQQRQPQPYYAEPQQPLYANQGSN